MYIMVDAAIRLATVQSGSGLTYFSPKVRSTHLPDLDLPVDLRSTQVQEVQVEIRLREPILFFFQVYNIIFH